MENKIKVQKEKLEKLGWKFLSKEEIMEGIFTFSKGGLEFVFYEDGQMNICASHSWYPITAEELTLFSEISETVKNNK